MNAVAFMILVILGLTWFLMVPVAVVAVPLGMIRWFRSNPRHKIPILNLLIGFPFTVGLMLIFFFFVDPISIDRSAPVEIIVQTVLINEALVIGLVDFLLIGNLAAIIYILKGGKVRTRTIIGSITLAHYCCNMLLVLPILERHATMTMT
ncbi:MAG: hypothetical protein KTR16_08615 [Acidiferrobacterales bacterium]|nr:hypothetical protein [Acidiferrobacterales bacterium]